MAHMIFHRKSRVCFLSVSNWTTESDEEPQILISLQKYTKTEKQKNWKGENKVSLENREYLNNALKKTKDKDHIT